MTTTTTPKNKFGFAVKNCTRCGGTGQFGPKSVQGGDCFGCAGVGTVVVNQKGWAAFVTAQRVQVRPIAAQVAVGDRIRMHASQPLRTVTAIRWEMLGRSTGGSTQGVAGHPNFVQSSRVGVNVHITFDDGDTLVTDPTVIVRRAGSADPTPFI